MLEESLSLDPLIFESPTMFATREGYGEGLVSAGEKNPNVVALCADLTESTKTDLFKKRFPDRFVQMGIGEQSMASVASGMAAQGKVPFFSSYAMFSPGRNWEQIRTTICYNNSNAKIVGAHAGVSVGPDGGTHQAIEDIALMRVLPRMTVISPCDAHEAKRATILSASYKGPVYIRLGREKTPCITSKESPFSIGRVYTLWRSKRPKITVFATGPVVYNALLAARALEEEGIGTIVVNVPTIKPLDEQVQKLSKETGLVMTIEEHQRIGGLGSAIAEFLSERSPMGVVRLGVDDCFGESGTMEELMKKHGLDPLSISEKIKKII